MVYVGRCGDQGPGGCNTGAVDILRAADLSFVASVPLPQGKFVGFGLDEPGTHLYVTTSVHQFGGAAGIATIDMTQFQVTSFLPTPRALLGAIVILPSGNVTAGPEAFAADIRFPVVHRIDLVTGQSIATIPLRTRASGIALSPDGSALYIGGDQLTAVDTANNSTIFQVYITQIASGVAVSPDGSRVYMGDYYESTLDIFDVGKRRVIARVPTGFRPLTVALSPDGGASYVAASGSSTVSQIDESTGAVVTKAEAGSEPINVHILPAGNFILAVNAYSSNVSVLSTHPFQRLTNIPTGYLPMASVLSPDGTRLYVSNYDATITVIDTLHQTVIDTIMTAPNHSTLAYGMAISSTGRTLYALTGYNSFQGILVIDTATDAILKSIPVFGDIAAIALGPLNDVAYISGNSNQPFLIVVDLLQGIQTDPIFVPSPFGVLVSPKGKYIYTGTTDNSAISVIDRATGFVVSHTPVAGNVRIGLNGSGSTLYASGPVITVFDTATQTVAGTIDTGGPSYGIDAQ